MNVAVTMTDSIEDLEPLFSYTHVQPLDVICIEDDTPDTIPLPCKTNRVSKNYIKVDDDVDIVEVIPSKQKVDDSWLPPPPKLSDNAQRNANNLIIEELRLKKQELQLLAQSAESVLNTVEEVTSNGLNASSRLADLDPTSERAKIVIAIQGKDEVIKKFRVFMDQPFERLFKKYAGEFNLDFQRLVFSFDGKNVNPRSTPLDLEMEDDDIIHVHVKNT